MVSFEEYKHHYLNFISSILGIREQELDIRGISDGEKNEFYNYSYGIKILYLVSFIESNFLTKQEFKQLRRFELIPNFDHNIQQRKLSCFIYIRDCVAHSPSIKLLPKGINTDAFIEIVEKGAFGYAQIIENKVLIDSRSIHTFYLMIRKLYNK